MPSVAEVVPAFGRIDGFDQAADLPPSVLDCSHLGLPHPVVALYETMRRIFRLFNGLQLPKIENVYEFMRAGQQICTKRENAVSQRSRKIRT